MNDVVAASRRWLRTALTSVRTALTASALTLLVGLGAISVFAAPQPPAAEIGLSARPMDRILERNQCSTTGFPPEVIPASAVIVNAKGRTRLVSFDRGWAVFTKEKPGDLVAVCLGEPKTGLRVVADE